VHVEHVDAEVVRRNAEALEDLGQRHHFAVTAEHRHILLDLHLLLDEAEQVPEDVDQAKSQET